MSRSAHAALAHHFDDLGQQREAATLGMWLFLVTEVLFFGGLFTTYLVYRNWYPDAFVAASHELVIWAGTVNTAILITSSLTMALAVRAAQTGDRRQLLILLVATMALGAAFLGRREPRAWFRFCVRRAVRSARAAFLFVVFSDDRSARGAHDHWSWHHVRDALAVLARHHHEGLLQPGRDRWSLLALR
jgi:heme/copper-type cytochrome/quinol oxidase subunit 3